MIFSKLMAHAAVGSIVGVGGMQVLETITPWEIAFDAHALIVAMHGAAGGMARWLFLREPWKDGLRLMLLGLLVAGGVGNLWSVLIKAYVGDVPESLMAQPQTAYAGSFLVGLLAVTVLGRIFDERKGEK